MKTIFSIVLFLLGMNCFGQMYLTGWPLDSAPKGVKVIELKSPRGSVTSRFYNIDRHIVKETYKNRGKIRVYQTFEYQKIDTLLVVKTNETLNFYEKEENYDKSVKKIYFYKDGKYSRFEIYPSEKSEEPSAVFDNFVYQDGLLQSYNWVKYGKDGNKSTTKVVFKRNDKDQLIQTHYCESNPNDDTYIVWKYNEQGQLTDRIKIIPDYLGTLDASSLLGDDFKSEQKMSKRHTVYTDFDAQGNWTKSVTIMPDGQKKPSYTRKFKYYQ